MRAEVTVRGAGVLGLACAFACARRGARVRVIDPGGIGAGASGGLVGALSPHAPDAARWDEPKALQLEGLLMAEAFWAAAREAGGIDPGFARTGRLMPLADARAADTARARGADAASLWPAPFSWTVEEAGQGDGAWGPLSATGLVARDTLAARVDPRRALASLAAAVRALGGEVGAGAPGEGPEEGTTGEEIAGEGITVEATGAAGLSARSLGGGVKGQAARLSLPGAGSRPQAYASGLYVVPHADGTVAVGSTSEKAWEDPTATDAALDDVVERARAVVPALRDAPVLERWAALRPRAADGGLLVGRRAPGGPILANGGFRTGFGMAPLVAAWVADLALDGLDRVPAPARADRLS